MSANDQLGRLTAWKSLLEKGFDEGDGVRHLSVRGEIFVVLGGRISMSPCVKSDDWTLGLEFAGNEGPAKGTVTAAVEEDEGGGRGRG